jgi:hypothetical protein
MLAVSLLASGVPLSACSLTLPVRGETETGDETFSGSATGYLDQSGTLTIQSNKGTTCTGDFVYLTPRQGRGTFRCSDGRSGPFEFVSAGSHGTGTGRLGERRFTFIFG